MLQELSFSDFHIVRNACLAATAAKSYTIIYLQRKLGLPEQTLPKIWHKVILCAIYSACGMSLHPPQIGYRLRLPDCLHRHVEDSNSAILDGTASQYHKLLEEREKRRVHSITFQDVRYSHEKYAIQLGRVQSIWSFLGIDEHHILEEDLYVCLRPCSSGPFLLNPSLCLSASALVQADSALQETVCMRLWHTCLHACPDEIRFVISTLTHRGSGCATSMTQHQSRVPLLHAMCGQDTCC